MWGLTKIRQKEQDADYQLRNNDQPIMSILQLEKKTCNL